MALPDLVILDTSALYALVSTSDEYHAPAVSVFENLVDREQRMAITSYVFVETGALVHRRLGFDVLKTLQGSLAILAETMWIDESVHQAAWQEFEGAQGSGPSFVDWTTIVTARRARGHVFAFDSDFKQQNVTVVP